MREGVAVVALAFTAMCTVGGFTPSAVLIFGASCAVIGAGVVLRRSLVSLGGLLALGLLSPFALEYPVISDGFTLLAVTALVTFAVGGLAHVCLTADEKRRFDWRVRGSALTATVAVGLAIVFSVVLLSGLGAVGTFLGDVESTGAQVIVLAFATAVGSALLLIPSPDGTEGQ